MTSKTPSIDELEQDLLPEPAHDIHTERNALDRFIARGGSLVGWLVFLAMVISVYEVIMRYGFDAPTSWVHETVIFLVAITFSLGGPVTLAQNRHIRVRVLYDSAGPAIKRWLDRFNDLITLLFCIAMSYAAFEMFWRASHNPMGDWQLERSGTSWNPPLPALTKGVILIALAVMTLQATLHLIQSCTSRRAAGENH